LQFGDVDSYWMLKQKINILLERDHIPSDRSIQEFFKSHFGSNYNSLNLKHNASAIAITIDVHKLGSRTNRTKDKGLYLDDSTNLKIATLKDIIYTYQFLLSHKEYEVAARYLKGSYLLYQRNKNLCLYDIPYGGIH
jgi:hypothetical protein